MLLPGWEGGKAWNRQRSLLPVDTGILLSVEISRVSKAMTLSLALSDTVTRHS